MYSISSSLFLLLALVHFQLYVYVHILVQRNTRRRRRRRRKRRRKKRRRTRRTRGENQICTLHAWKPLVERGRHSETNKHTPFMFISTATRSNNKNARKKEAINEGKKNRNVFLIINIQPDFSVRHLFFLVYRTVIFSGCFSARLNESCVIFHFFVRNFHRLFSPMCRFAPFDDAHWSSTVYPPDEPLQGEEKKSNQPDEDDNVEIGLVPTRQTHLVIPERDDTNESLPSPFTIVRFSPSL